MALSKDERIGIAMCATAACLIAAVSFGFRIGAASADPGSAQPPPTSVELPWIFAVALLATLFTCGLRSLICRQRTPAVA